MCIEHKKTDHIKSVFKSLHTTMAMVPSGCTSLVQALDVCINTPLSVSIHHLRTESNKRLQTIIIPISLLGLGTRQDVSRQFGNFLETFCENFSLLRRADICETVRQPLKECDSR